MTDHDKLKVFIDNIPNLKAEDEKGTGNCFGVTVLGLHSVITGNDNQFFIALRNLIEEYDNIPRDSDNNLSVAEHIQNLKNNPLTQKRYQSIEWLCKNIVYAQSPRRFKNILGQDDDYNEQYTSVKKMFNFLTSQAEMQTIVAVEHHEGFPCVVDRDAFLKLFSIVDKSTNNRIDASIAFIISYLGHTWGCAYSEFGGQWSAIDVNTIKIGQTRGTIDKMATYAWNAVKFDKNAHRAVYIQPMVFSNDKSLVRRFDAFASAELLNIKNYSGDKLLELYVNADNYRHQETLSAILSLKNINSNLSRFEKMIKMTGERKECLIDCILQNKDDIALGLIYTASKKYLNRLFPQGTALHYAIKKNKPYIARKIIGTKLADVNLPSGDGISPLKLALIHQMHNIAIAIIQSIRYVPNRYDVLYAVKYYHKESLHLLLNKNVKLNVPDETGYTPLHYAVLSGKPEIVKILLDSNRRVDLHVKCKNGQTALDLAEQSSNQIIKGLMLPASTPTVSRSLSFRTLFFKGATHQQNAHSSMKKIP